MTLPLHGFQDWQNPLHTADLQTDVNSQNINAAATFTTTVYDMRGYQSLSLMISAVSNVNPKTGWGDVEYQINWYANDTGSQIIFHERYAFFPQGVGGAFASANGRVMHKGPVLGPYMSITVLNGGPDQILLSWRVLGNTKATTARTMMNTDINGQNTNDQDMGVFGAVGANVAAGGTFDTVENANPGQAQLSIQTGNTTFTISFITPSGQTFWQISLIANSSVNTFVVLPRCAYRVHLANTGAVLAFAGVQGAIDAEGWK